MDVRLPDGTLVQNVPEGTTQEQLTATLRANGHSVPQAQAEPGVWGRVKNSAGDLGRGATSMVDSAANFLGHLTGAGQPEPISPRAFPDRVPTGPIDRLVKAGTEGVGGAAAGGMFNPMGMASGFTAGVGTQLAKNAELGPIGEIIAALAGGMTPLGAKSLSNVARGSNAPALAKAVLKDVPDESLDAARQRMVDAKATVPPGVNLSQAMNQPSNIDDIVNHLAQHPQGVNVQAQLNAQPDVVRAMGQLAQSQLPGTRLPPQMVADRAQEVATGAITAERQARTAATGPKYQSAPLVAPDAPAAIVSEIQKVRSAPGIEPTVVLASKKLEDAILRNANTGEESRNPQDIAAAIREFRQSLVGNPNNPASPSVQGQAAKIVDKAVEALGLASPQTAEANALYRKLTETQVSPLKKSIVGQVAGVQGALEDRAAGGNKLYQAFNRGTPDPANSDILAFEKAARSQDRTMFPNAVKSYIGDKLDAISPIAEARVDPHFSALVQKALAATPSQEQGLKDMLAGVARSQGVPEGEVANGFMNFVKAATITARRPAKVAGLGAEGIQEIAGKSSIGGIATSMTPGRIGTKLEGRYSAGAREVIDKLLTTPEGLDKLRELAKIDPTSSRAQALVGTLLGGAAASGSPAQ